MDTGTITQKSGIALYAGEDWQLVARHTVAGAAETSYTFSGLTGDTETEYRLIIYHVQGGASGYSIYLYLNGDAETNDLYGYQMIYGTNTTIAADRGGGVNTPWYSTFGTTSNNVSFSDTIIHAKSGYLRTGISKQIASASGTTISYIMQFGYTWNNTADQITSIEAHGQGANTLGVGTDLFLFARRLGGNTATSGHRYGSLNVKGNLNAGVFQLKERYEVTGSAANSKTFSGLTGNTNPLYLFTARFVNGYNGTQNYNYTLNNDTGANYGYQQMNGENTTGATTRGTGQSSLILSSATAQNQICHTNFLLYAKSGVIRAILQDDAAGIATTTVTRMRTMGQIWSNTANELTSIEFLQDQVAGYGIGTVMELYQLNLGI